MDFRQKGGGLGQLTLYLLIADISSDGEGGQNTPGPHHLQQRI